MIFRIKRFFRENLEEKLIALIVTLVIWAVVVSRTEETRSFIVGINLNTGNDKILLSEPVKSVHVQATGNRFDFARIDDSMLEVKIDLSHKEPGKAIFYLDPARLPFSKFLRVSRIFPNEIIYTTARRISKKLKIEPYLDGQPKAGYRISSVVVSPDVVTVSGSEDFLREMESVTTEKISLNGLSDTKELSSRISLRSPQMRVEDPEDNVVVRIEIERDVREYLFRKVPVLLDDGTPADISPQFLDIRLKGPSDELERLKKEGVTLYVEARKERSYTVEKYYLKKLPPLVQPVKLPRIKIRVKKR